MLGMQQTQSLEICYEVFGFEFRFGFGFGLGFEFDIQYLDSELDLISNIWIWL